MKKYYETKVGKIIEKNFDSRMTNTVIQYIVDKGWENVKEITDEQIKDIKGNALMTDIFCQSFVRAAREICITCDFWEDFLSYIRCYIGINGYQTKETTLYRDDCQPETWMEIENDLDLYDEVDEIDLLAIVMETRCKINE